VRGRIGGLVAAAGRLGLTDRRDQLPAAREQAEVEVIGEQIDVIYGGRQPLVAVTGPADLHVGERLVVAGRLAADAFLDLIDQNVELGLRGRVDAQVQVGEVAVDVGVAVAGTEPAGSLAANLDDLIGEQAALVLRERVGLPEREAAPVLGGDVRDAVARATDGRVIGVFGVAVAVAVTVTGLVGLVGAGLAAGRLVARLVVVA